MGNTHTTGELATESGKDSGRDPSVLPGFLTVTVFLMLTWLVFSDKRDLFHLGAGLASAVFVTALTRDLMVAGVRRTRRGRRVLYYVWSYRWHRLFLFVPWLFWKIAAANLQTARMVLHPRMPIDPAIFEVDTGLRTDLARLALAATITLTPGTCVLDVRGDRFVVHRIHPRAANDIRSGNLIEMVRATFELEGHESYPDDAVETEGGAHARA